MSYRIIRIKKLRKNKIKRNSIKKMKQKTCWGVTADRTGRPAWIMFSFKGFGVIACEPNANAPCDWKLIVQLKEKEEFYIASQMEDGSIKESSSDNLQPLSDFLQINYRFGTFNAKYGKILLTLSTRDGKNKTYAVKDVNVKNDNELEFILGPGPDPNDVPFSNMAEEMQLIIWFSGDQRLNPSLWSYVNWKLEFPGFSRYNAGEDSLEVRWSDIPVAGALAAPLFAVNIPIARDAATPLYLLYWVQVQIANEMPITVNGIDRKGRRMSMVRKVSGYSFTAGKLRLELSSKGLKAKSGDIEANMILRGFKNGKYRNVGITSFIDRALGLGAGASFGGTSRYSYSFPVLAGVMKKGMDGKIRIAFKEGAKKALQYDKETGILSSMDVGDVLEVYAENKGIVVSVKRSGGDMVQFLLEKMSRGSGDDTWVTVFNCDCALYILFLEGESLVEEVELSFQWWRSPNAFLFPLVRRDKGS